MVPLELFEEQNTKKSICRSYSGVSYSYYLFNSTVLLLCLDSLNVILEEESIPIPDFIPNLQPFNIMFKQPIRLPTSTPLFVMAWGRPMSRNGLL